MHLYIIHVQTAHIAVVHLIPFHSIFCSVPPFPPPPSSFFCCCIVYAVVFGHFVKRDTISKTSGYFCMFKIERELQVGFSNKLTFHCSTTSPRRCSLLLFQNTKASYWQFGASILEVFDSQVHRYIRFRLSIKITLDKRIYK